MKNTIVSIIIIAIVALFLIPESWMGEYKGLLKVKYTLKSEALKVKNILTSLIRGEEVKEFDDIKERFEEEKESIKNEIKETLKETAKDAIDEL